MNKTLKTIICIVLALCAIFLVYKIYDGIMEPVRFNKEVEARQKVAVQRLKDIRDLQVAFKSVNERFTASFDTLKQFYNNGEMVVLMQVGSKDDSLAVAHTNDVKKSHKGITDEGLYKLYQEGDKKLVFSIQNKIAVKDTLFRSRTDFDVNKIDEIPFAAEGETVAAVTKIEMDAVVKKVSGVNVPLFEAKMPWKSILNGMNHQLVVNKVAECEDQGRIVHFIKAILQVCRIAYSTACFSTHWCFDHRQIVLTVNFYTMTCIIQNCYIIFLKIRQIFIKKIIEFIYRNISSKRHSHKTQCLQCLMNALCIIDSIIQIRHLVIMVIAYHKRFASIVQRIIHLSHHYKNPNL